MDKEIIGLIGLAMMVVLLLLRMPVALTMIFVGIGGNFILSLLVPYIKFEPYIKQFKHLLWGVISHYDLSVIPLFIFMGFLASYAQISRDLFHGFHALFGRFKGGVAMAAIGACAGFGAVCGSSLATASTMGKVALPELQRLKYSPRLATGTLAAGGTLGILIPPSVALVIYAIIVEASIIEMFQAAIIPGVIAIIFFIAVIAIQVRLHPNSAPAGFSMNRHDYKIAMMKLLPVLSIFGIIILGLGFGIFTPTPAAAIGATLILVYGVLLRYYSSDSGLDISLIKKAILDTAITTAMLYFIIFGAEILKGFFARAGLPVFMMEMVLNSHINAWFIMIIILLILIILGCFMDSLSMILVVVPFIWPALIVLNGGDYVSAENATFGVDTENLKIWFGIMALITVELGLITPPVGLNVFIISSLTKTIKMIEIFKGVMPFFTAEIIRIIILLLFPALCLFLPNYIN